MSKEVSPRSKDYISNLKYRNTFKKGTKINKYYDQKKNKFICLKKTKWTGEKSRDIDSIRLYKWLFKDGTLNLSKHMTFYIPQW